MKRSGLVSLALAAALLGCGGPEGAADRPPVYPTTGVVTHNGSPVEGAQVTFNPESREGRGAFGRTNAEGEYELQTFEPGDGAMAGKYIVTITKYDAPLVTETEVPEEDYVPPEAQKEKPAAPKNLLPNKYSAMHTSGLTAEVKEGGENKFDFQLTD